MTATNTQQAILGALFAPLADGVTASSGVVSGGNALTVTQTSTSSMAVVVNPQIWVVPGPSPTTTGPFIWSRGTSPIVVPIQPADPSNPRIDNLVVQVNDPGTATVNGDADYAVIQGTPAASPAAPPVTASQVFIRNIRVNVGDTSVTNARITGTAPTASIRQTSGNVTAPGKTIPRIWYGTVTVTPDASGFATWTHNAGVVPTAITVEMQAPISGGLFAVHATDTYTTTQARTRFLNLSNAAAIISTVTFRWAAYA
jgi:hypothetical protein